MFPYGSQYYRTPNPPQEDWENDLAEMARHGFTVVKHFAMWSYMHTGEDSFDFSHMDRLLDLSKNNGLRVIINILLENAPHWLIAKHPEACYTDSDGRPITPFARSTASIGGWPGLCWDNPAVAEQAEKFLRAIGERYADSDALMGYDVWNEVFFEPAGHPGMENRRFCYCSASRTRFLYWLKAKYGSIDAISEAWRRRFSDWNEVYTPTEPGSYPDWLDWLKFRLENHANQMRWRMATLRNVDSTHELSAHGIGYTLHGMPTYLTDDFEIAQEVDHWGLSNFPLGGNQSASEHMCQLDLVKSASAAANKEFWQTELQGGQTCYGIARGLIARAIDISFWNWCAFMCGARGLMYWQWRPELFGMESPGYGLCKLDGSPSDRTQAAAKWAQFMNEHPELQDVKPMKGDAAILVLPESQLFCYAADEKTDYYAGDVFGLYKALWEANVSVDFIKIDRIDEYPLVFLPFPLMIEAKHAKMLKNYVAGGGNLVSHACPGHFIDNGFCSTRVPGLGLDELFGAMEDETEFIPALERVGRDVPTVVRKDTTIPCAVYQEKLHPTTGQQTARFSDGSVAMVDSDFVRGKARLIGTFPGLSYWKTGNSDAAKLIVDSLVFAGVQQAVETSEPEVIARLHTGDAGVFLWVLNTSWAEKDVEIDVDRAIGTISGTEEITEGHLLRRGGNSLIFTLPPRDGAIVRLAFKI